MFNIHSAKFRDINILHIYIGPDGAKMRILSFATGFSLDSPITFDHKRNENQLGPIRSSLREDFLSQFLLLHTPFLFPLFFRRE